MLKALLTILGLIANIVGGDLYGHLMSSIHIDNE